ncbi:hydrolase [Leifsonia sp. Root112D2]|nr:hydrolase [Leifsonia sp. Root112D2]
MHAQYAGDVNTTQSVWICVACGVERRQSATPPESCPICLDERQYVPRSGQAWTSLERLTAEGTRVLVAEVEPGLHAITTEPQVGIGQQSLLVQTDAGNLLWDPTGFVDEEGAARVRELGPVVAIVASHPHMYGAQVQWSRLLDDAPVYVAEADRDWVQRPDANIRSFVGDFELVPGLTLHTIGGHFRGSLAALWSAGAHGRGVLLAGDGIFPGPDGLSVSFLRSYPNRIPLSAAVVERIARRTLELEFDRLYGNFGGVIDGDAHAVIRRSAARYIGWVRGDFDHLT